MSTGRLTTSMRGAVRRFLACWRPMRTTPGTRRADVYRAAGDSWTRTSTPTSRTCSYSRAGSTGSQHYRPGHAILGPLRPQLQQRGLERHADGVRRRRRDDLHRVLGRSRRRRPRAEPRRHRGHEQPDLPESVGCAERGVLRHDGLGHRVPLRFRATGRSARTSRPARTASGTWPTPARTATPSHYADRYTGTSDNGGVHTNGGIANHWFYLLVDGGQNANLNRRDGVAVQGIGLAAAKEIAFDGFTALPATADFCAARGSTIAVAGGYSTSVAAAWDEVGVDEALCSGGRSGDVTAPVIGTVGSTELKGTKFQNRVDDGRALHQCGDLHRHRQLQQLVARDQPLDVIHRQQWRALRVPASPQPTRAATRRPRGRSTTRIDRRGTVPDTPRRGLSLRTPRAC